MKRRDLADNTLRLEFFYPTKHPVDSRRLTRGGADTTPDAIALATHRRITAVSEEIGLDYLFIADRWARYGPESTTAHHQDPMLATFILGANW